MKFLRELSRLHKENEFYFKYLKDIRFKPDGENDLPKEIEWMEERISKLILQGKNLHDTIFIKKKDLHPYIVVSQLEASYNLEHKDYSGDCSVVLEFPENKGEVTSDSELVIKVANLKFAERNSAVLKSKVREDIMGQFEKIKLELYENLKTEK